MADVSMKEFLLQFYMQMHFNAMDTEQFAAFQDACKKDDLTKGQKDWKKKLVHQDTNGNWAKNGLPDAENGQWRMDDPEWEKLFKAFQNAFRSMAAKKDDLLKDGKTEALDFMNNYFGNAAYQPFSFGQASPETEAEIQELYNILDDPDPSIRNSVMRYIYDVLKDGGITLSDLKKGIDSQKYNKDPKFRETLQNVARNLSYYLPSDVSLSAKYADKDFSNIINSFEKSGVDPAKMSLFKPVYGDLLETLYRDKKVFDVFKEHDGGKISGHITDAQTKVNYSKGSDDYVPPKRDDLLTPWQQMNRWVGDTWSDYMDKYLKLRPDHAYLSPQAQAIVKGINGAKLKPTDGLEKIVDSFGTVKKAITSPTAASHFKWFEETMTELKGDKNLKHIFAGALRNGRQMKALVSEICMKGAREGKMDEAKTAMEVLYVIRYTHTTSKIMDALGKESFSVFSDGDLTWNKNEGVKLVTNALDKSIKTAFMGVGYAITFAGNTINRSGRKFNNKTGRMQTEFQKAHDSVGKQRAIDERDTKNAVDDSEKQAEQTRLNDLQTVHGIDQNTFWNKKDELKTKRNAEKTAKTARDTAEQEMQTAKQTRDNTQKIIDDYDKLGTDRMDVLTQLGNINTRITTLQAQINNPATYMHAGAPLPAPAANAIGAKLQAELDDLQNRHKDLTTQESDLYNQINDPAVRAAYNNARHDIAGYNTDFTNKENAFNIADGAYNTAHADADDLSNNLDSFKSATARVQELQSEIDRRNKVVKDWDKNHQGRYAELMAHWDLLSKGDSWMPGSAKKKQKKMDAKLKQDWLVARYAKYGNVA